MLWSGVGTGLPAAVRDFSRGVAASERCWESLVGMGDVGRGKTES